MEVRLADCAGFCFGVKRAVDTVYEQLKNGKTIYTYGPIVHNEEVVRELAEKGVRVLESKEELKSLKAGENIPTVIIRAHGVAKEIVAVSVHLFRHEPKGFARTVQRYGRGCLAVARGDAVETVDVEAQCVAAPVDDNFSLLRRRFRCVEHGVTAVRNTPDKRLPAVAEFHPFGLPAFAAFLP